MAWSETLDTTNSLIGNDLTRVEGFVGVTSGSEDNILNALANYASDFCNRYTKRLLKSRSLTERYNGNGSEYLYIDQYPITAITRLAIGVYGAVKINNSSTTTNATVSVSSTGLTLTLDGTADTTITFATYDTLTKLVDAVNALGSNWQASLVSTEYSSFKSSELIKKYGAYCLDNTWAYLNVPDGYIDDYEVDEDIGELYYSGGFTVGNKNIFIDYTAGYTTVPDDLSEAALEIIGIGYKNWKENTLGVTNRTIGDGSITLETIDIPKRAYQILDRYRKRRV